ncbi:NACHT, LRR and PYD domains-containing protein 7-like, partial [Sturnira hondurensis]|uniref:NACHT, LRR and PYD domains-containing protein 7-like n=1 Tax=Sturnira hondurensis TaxID=192404 RepID=UPI00187A092B
MDNVVTGGGKPGWELTPTEIGPLSNRAAQHREERNTMERVYTIWKHIFWPGDGDDFHYKVTSRSQKFTSFWSPKTPTQLGPLTVVLHGPAGIGKTTLAKKWMLEWRQDKLPNTLKFTFYLSCKEVKRHGRCTFAELVSKTRVDSQGTGFLDQAQNILFVIDGFDELRVPPESLIHDICGNWMKQKPVPILLASLLKRKLLPKATLLVTTRPRALRELRLLTEQPVFIEVEGLSELGRRDYFLKHFEHEDQALRAFEAMRSNPVLFHMGCMPAVCWVACRCLRQQMEQGQDLALTCQTTTSLFLRFLCGQFTPTPASCPPGPLQAALRAVCLLAAEGLWEQTSVLNGEDIRRLGLKESDLRPFLDKDIIHEDLDCEGYYAFIHVSVQQLLTAVFYILDSEKQKDGGSHKPNIGNLQTLLSKEERLKNPNLTHVGYFLFGLFNEQRARELERTFGYPVSSGVKQELLRSLFGRSEPFSSTTEVKEVLYCLFESQEELLVKEATAHVSEMSLHLQSKVDLVHSAFCLQHWQNLQKVSLKVEEGIFLDDERASESHAWVERCQHDQQALRFWRDLCSVFSSKENLSSLDVSQSFLSSSSVRILCEQITRATCHLQKVVIKNVCPVDAYRDFCLAFIGKKSLTHLTLEGGAHSNTKLLLLLCEALKHRTCNLQYLRLGSCSDILPQWDDFSSALTMNQSLQCLDLTAIELRDEGVTLLCATLKHPKCFLQRLSLENCHMTGACCKELSSALIVNQRLTHLCLANNDLGDGGVQLLCEGLSYPDCQLQILVLYKCNITSRGCKHIATVLQGGSCLTHLDLGLNPIATGLQFLCEALKKPDCNLKFLGLYGCSISSLCCQDLASALGSNQRLEALDLGQNTLGQDGIMVLLEALKQSHGPLMILRLMMDEPNGEIQQLLQELKDVNPNLTIDHQNARVTRSSYGIGKTTLAKKWMLEWKQDKLPETLKFSFYLSCKEVKRHGRCTFAELVSKTRVDSQGTGFLEQAQNILFVIDAFDELRVPSESLIHDICGNWMKKKPVPILLASLLKRKLLPKATLLITTRPRALRELRLLTEQPVFIEVEGLSELGRRDYFLKHFEHEDQALRAFEAMRSNPVLFHMGCMPAVCWVACRCLRQQMEQGQDLALTCQTTTSLFLRFLCGQFTPTPASCPPGPLQAALRAVCLLAAEGLWEQISVLNGEDIRSLGLKESDLRPFLDKDIIHEDLDCEGYYAFIHVSVQQLLTAVFYILDSDEQKDGGSRKPNIGNLQTLLSKEERLKNPDLTHVVYFLFGLSNEQRAKELERTFGYPVSSGVKQELLRSLFGRSELFSSTTDVKEVLYCLFESQEELLVTEATAHVREMSLHLQSKVDLVHSAFCLQHWQNLQKVSLQVEKGIFLEDEGASESHAWVE